jgi:serine/threonine protein phosphatase 1
MESQFSVLENPRRIWAVSALHGEADRLRDLHARIGGQFCAGDRIVYLGNYSGGTGDRTVKTIDELLLFRRAMMALPAVRAEDVVYLRGTHEEMWHKILQIQFAPSPASVIEWMLNKGVEGALAAYGSTGAEALRAAREGIMSMTRWTSRLREQLRLQPGHEKFFTSLRRAAISEVSALCLAYYSAQGDSFWWGNREFDGMTSAFAPFTCVVRGFDPSGGGLRADGFALSLYDGAGYGGDLVAVRLAANGNIEEWLRA